MSIAERVSARTVRSVIGYTDKVCFGLLRKILVDLNQRGWQHVAGLILDDHTVLRHYKNEITGKQAFLSQSHFGDLQAWRRLEMFRFELIDDFAAVKELHRELWNSGMIADDPKHEFRPFSVGYEASPIPENLGLCDQDLICRLFGEIDSKPWRWMCSLRLTPVEGDDLREPTIAWFRHSVSKTSLHLSDDLWGLCNWTYHTDGLYYMVDSCWDLTRALRHFSIHAEECLS